MIHMVIRELVEMEVICSLQCRVRRPCMVYTVSPCGSEVAATDNLTETDHDTFLLVSDISAREVVEVAIRLRVLRERGEEFDVGKVGIVVELDSTRQGTTYYYRKGKERDLTWGGGHEVSQRRT